MAARDFSLQIQPAQHYYILHFKFKELLTAHAEASREKPQADESYERFRDCFCHHDHADDGINNFVVE